MKQKDTELVKQAKKAVFEYLYKIPFLKFSEPSLETRYTYADFIIKTRVDDKPWNLICCIGANGQPLNIRNVANQVIRYKEQWKNVYVIFIAPYISEKGAAICKEEGFGYVDFSGNGLVSFENVYIEQHGQPNQQLIKRDLRTLYSPKAERVLRTILNSPEKAWLVKALATEATVSIGLVSNIKKLLTEREWLVPGDELKLKSPGEVLKAWANNYDYRKNDIQQYYSLASVSETEAIIASACQSYKVNYAFTGFSGAARFAPMVTYNRVMVYAEKKFEDYLVSCGLKKVESGANVMVYYPYDEGVFLGAKQIDNTNVVSPVQLYLDLIGYKGRGEEAAQAIWERILKFNVD
ncbi:MAG: hypothetical protein JNL74_00110 [Fibrobacteres bacterium]|nr:hypothetical protein [Fibrobacterota bacterium]